MRIGFVELVLLLFIASITVGPNVALFADRWLRRAQRTSAAAARRKAQLEAQAAIEREALMTRFRVASNIFALLMLAALAAMCVVGPGMTGYDYDAVSLSEKNALPSSEHWFGTDKMGRDLFTRVWIGGRISMILGIAGAAIDMLIGVVYGGVAAYFGGKTDAIMMRIVEILASIPYLLLVVLVSLIVGKGVGSLLIAMCLTGWCHMARLVRGQVLQLKDQEYLLAAKALGTPWYKVIFRHLIPNTLGVVIVAVTFDVPSFIFGEAFLSYIGLGVQSPMTSWGSLASNAQQTMAFYPYQLFFPAFFIALTMLSFQLLGDGLRDALDPKLRQ